MTMTLILIINATAAIALLLLLVAAMRLPYRVPVVPGAGHRLPGTLRLVRPGARRRLVYEGAPAEEPG